MIFDPIASLKTLLANYSFATVNIAIIAGNPLTADIAVKTEYETKSTKVDYDNGVLLIDDSLGKIAQPNHESYRNENWVMPCRVIYKPDPQALHAIFSEIDRVFNSNNANLQNPRYLWEYRNLADQYVNQLDILIKIERTWVQVDV